MDIIFIRDLRIDTVIGIYDWERAIKQTLSFDLEMATDIARAAASDCIDDTLNYKAVAKRIIAFVEDSDFQLVETLAERVAEEPAALEPVGHPRLEERIVKLLDGDEAIGVFLEVAEHLLRGEEEPALALQGLGGETLHGGGRDEGLVESDDAGERARLRLVGRGQDDEVADGHRLVVDFAAGDELVVVGEALFLEMIDVENCVFPVPDAYLFQKFLFVHCISFLSINNFFYHYSLLDR